MPSFACFFETLDQPVSPADAAWSARLPLSRHSAGGAPPAAAEDAPSVGDYFAAVRSYLEGPGTEALARVLAGAGLPGGQVTEFRLMLAKHGAYYHPCRIVAAGHGRQVDMVLNVALSSAGRVLAPREFAILKRLKQEYEPAYVPEVYGFGEVSLGRGAAACMFLGQWLDGFHEFHLTRRATGMKPTIVVWDPEHGRRYPDPDQIRRIYSQAARILTHYFNPGTFECIGAWHHAAGDFVVRLTGARLELRLISVREYRPIFSSRHSPGATPPPMRSVADLQALLEALLVFFLDLSVRMRIDRLDGVGDFAWSGPATVAATLDGMLQALSESPLSTDLPLPLDLVFKHFLLSTPLEDLRELCSAILAANPLSPPAAALVDTRLEEHLEALAKAFGGL